MGFALKLALAIIVAALLGAVLLANSLGKGLDAMSVRNGDWVTSVTTGADDAGAISRAAVSIGGLLASTRENSIYYRLATLAGEPLRLDCRYRVRGESYDAELVEHHGLRLGPLPHPEHCRALFLQQRESPSTRPASGKSSCRPPHRPATGCPSAKLLASVAPGQATLTS
jgi:hypothetical protein